MHFHIKYDVGGFLFVAVLVQTCARQKIFSPLGIDLV
jgi:hypothetical protein